MCLVQYHRYHYSCGIIPYKSLRICPNHLDCVSVCFVFALLTITIVSGNELSIIYDEYLQADANGNGIVTADDFISFLGPIYGSPGTVKKYTNTISLTAPQE